jgi:hypothetical protein
MCVTSIFCQDSGSHFPSDLRDLPLASRRTRRNYNRHYRHHIKRSQVVLPMISRPPFVLGTISLYLLLLICGSSYHFTVALASPLSPDSSTSTSMSTSERAKTGMRNDAAAYNEFVSAAVDLSDAHVSKDGLLTGTVHRSAPLHIYWCLDCC